MLRLKSNNAVCDELSTLQLSVSTLHQSLSSLAGDIEQLTSNLDLLHVSLLHAKEDASRSRTTSIASRMAYNSAVKMLAASGNRTHLVLSQWTTAAATLLPSLEPSVNMR